MIYRNMSASFNLIIFGGNKKPTILSPLKRSLSWNKAVSTSGKNTET